MRHRLLKFFPGKPLDTSGQLPDGLPLHVSDGQSPAGRPYPDSRRGGRRRNRRGSVRHVSPEGIEMVMDPIGGSSFGKSYRCLGPTGRLVVYGFFRRRGAAGKTQPVARPEGAGTDAAVPSAPAHAAQRFGDRCEPGLNGRAQGAAEEPAGENFSAVFRRANSARDRQEVSPLRRLRPPTATSTRGRTSARLP
jgi:hypothetical protein